MKKMLLKLTCCLFAIVLAFGATACSGTSDSNSTTLKIQVTNYGYGVDWLNETASLFKSQDWVKAKYPNIDVQITETSDKSQANTEVTSGSTIYDLFFACTSIAGSAINANSKGENVFLELTDVYNATIPNESTTVKAKMNQSMYNYYQVESKDGTKGYYSIPWVNGYIGLVYNSSLVTGAIPTTTDGLISLAKDLKANGTVPFIFSSAESYWSQLFTTWWAQYEGETNYENYWNCVDITGTISNSVIAQQGRLEALKVLQNLLTYSDEGTKNLCYDGVNTISFTNAQSLYVQGKAEYGAMMPSGDWLENELKKSSSTVSSNIQFMKLPVISSIINTTECKNAINDDAQLQTVIASIDAGEDFATAKGKLSTLTEQAFNKVKQARSLIYTVEGHEAFIPSYATNKEIAKDFLIFLASDVAIEKFMTVTNGVSTPYTYDTSKLESSFSALQKSRIAITKNATSIRPYVTFKSNYNAGLTNFAKTSNIVTAFTTKTASDRKTAQKIYDDDIAHFNNEANWNTITSNI